MTKEIIIPADQQPKLMIFEKRQEDNYFNFIMNTSAVDSNNEEIPMSIRGVVKLPQWITGMPLSFVSQENDKLCDIIFCEEGRI